MSVPLLNHNQMQYILSIDPSIASLGYAVHMLGSFYDENKKEFPYWQIMDAGRIQVRDTKLPYQLRAMTMCEGLLQSKSVLPMMARLRQQATLIVTETPSNWFTDKGMASKDDEDIQKLYWMVGALSASCKYGFKGRCIMLAVTPQVWKGQANKKIVQGRAEKYMKENFDAGWNQPIQHDIADALLLGRMAVQKVVPKIYEGDSPPDGWHILWSDGMLGLDEITRSVPLLDSSIVRKGWVAAETPLFDPITEVTELKSVAVELTVASSKGRRGIRRTQVKQVL